VTYPQRVICPACDSKILLVLSARRGGIPSPFDPDPRTGDDHYDTRLAEDLSHVSVPAAAGKNLFGRIDLYRAHVWSCPAGLKVPAGRTCPSWAGYSQAAATGKTGPALEPAPLPHPWQGIKGTARDQDDLLSLADAAMPRRRVMVMQALAAYRAVTAPGSPAPAIAQMSRRMRNPEPGDLVVEVSAARRPGSERRGMGILLAHRRESLSPEWEYSHAMGDEAEELSGNESQAADAIAADAYYIQYGPSERDVARWDSAQIIVCMADERDALTGGSS
jgi:hypothetical protein